jgi:hypothetical protein
MFQARLSPGSGHGGLLVAAAWGLTTVVGLVIVSTVMTGSSHAQTNTGATHPVRAGTLPTGAGKKMTRPGTLPAKNPSEPLIDGRKTTVAGAQEAAGYAIPLPHADTASNANLTQVWIDGKREVALVYDSGKLTITMMPAISKDPEKRFQAFIKQSKDVVKAAMARVNGQPALAISPNTDPYNANAAWIEFYRDGTDINVFSHHYGLATLLAVAESIK